MKFLSRAPEKNLGPWGCSFPPPLIRPECDVVRIAHAHDYYHDLILVITATSLGHNHVLNLPYPDETTTVGYANDIVLVMVANHLEDSEFC